MMEEREGAGECEKEERNVLFLVYSNPSRVFSVEAELKMSQPIVYGCTLHISPMFKHGVTYSYCPNSALRITGYLHGAETLCTNIKIQLITTVSFSVSVIPQYLSRIQCIRNMLDGYEKMEFEPCQKPESESPGMWPTNMDFINLSRQC